MTREQDRISVAITGASGVTVGVRVAEYLHSLGYRVEIIVTRGAARVAEYEEGLAPASLVERLSSYGTVYWEDDFASPLASSSNQPSAMAVVPASMKTVAAIANGLTDNLVSRAALAILRLGRRLVVAPRETPLGVIELENLLKLARAGAVVTPLMAGFYHKPRTVKDIIDFLAGKVLDSLGISHNLYRRWGGEDHIVA